jgi:hypothetical protein
MTPMLPQSHLLVLTRNETWSEGEIATEPTEVGWAREAMVFIRALKPVILPRGGVLRVQVSPDGIHWADHGATVALPDAQGAMTVASIERFGGWIRLAGSLQAGESITVLVSIHLKA